MNLTDEGIAYRILIKGEVRFSDCRTYSQAKSISPRLNYVGLRQDDE